MLPERCDGAGWRPAAGRTVRPRPASGPSCPWRRRPPGPTPPSITVATRNGPPARLRRSCASGVCSRDRVRSIRRDTDPPLPLARRAIHSSAARSGRPRGRVGHHGRPASRASRVNRRRVAMTETRAEAAKSSRREAIARLRQRLQKPTDPAAAPTDPPAAPEPTPTPTPPPEPAAELEPEPVAVEEEAPPAEAESPPEPPRRAEPPRAEA